MKALRLRPLAGEDLTRRTLYYRRESGDELGDQFFDAAIAALRRLEHTPAIGSLRLGEMCGVDGLRSIRLRGFLVGWFYFDRPDNIDVVRLLSYSQDLQEVLGGVDDDI